MFELRTTQVNVPPDMIDLGIGQPGLDTLPLDVIRRAADHRLAQASADMLNYGREQGDGFFLEALASFLGKGYGTDVSPDHLFVTGGASQALDLICTLFTQPGDTIFAEEPSYFLALRIFADHGLNVVGIPMDEQGLSIDALEEALQRHRPLFLYTIPTFQNPTGITLPQSRREQLVELSNRHDFLVIADEVYHLLNYGALPSAPLASYVAESPLFSIGSFSKILAPGLRLGWIQASPSLVDQFVKCGMVDSGGGLNPFTSSIVRSVLELGLQNEYLAMLKRTYTQRVTALDEALQSCFGSAVSYVRPDGGFFFWLRLADAMDAQTLLAATRHRNASFQPGVRFSSRRGLQDCLRLSFAFYDVDDLREGVRRIADGASDLPHVNLIAETTAEY